MSNFSWDIRVRRAAAPFLVAVASLCVSACDDSESKYGATGIGSIELNDSVFAIHYYSSTMLVDRSFADGLKDSARVYFSGSGTLAYENEDGQTYDFSIYKLSSDVTTPFLSLDSVAQSSADTMRIASSHEGFYAQNIHITRDWRRNDFLDATGIYPGDNNGDGDFFGFVLDTASLGSDTVCVWLRLRRERTDTVQMITRHISTPVNCLRDTTRERIMVNLRRLDANGDTVVSNLVYSYVNWVE